MNKENMLYELDILNNHVEYTTSIQNALKDAELEIYALDENIETINNLKVDCDKTDYALAASSGALCGIIDIFLVGKPGETPIGNITDKWYEDRIIDFANIMKKSKKYNSKATTIDSFSSAVRFLENEFNIPYDQRGMGDTGSTIYGLNPSNHHFKSLAHNPNLFGLFFSVLDQFTNSSHFVTEGNVISLKDADNNFELRGNNILSKIFFAFVNWFGHLISDISGSSSSKGRGMGIPSPLYSWANDIVVIKRNLNIPVSEFNQILNEIALKIYEEGYDARFQTAQAIPVFINELFVRLMYSVRRLIKCFIETEQQNRSLSLIWEKCKPFKNSTVKRMLTVAHATFCVLDIGDATIKSFILENGEFNPTEFFLRLNIVGVGRFTISLYGEFNQCIKKYEVRKKLESERKILENYIEGLRLLSKLYDDKELVNFADDLKNGMYIEAFEKTVKLAQKRNVLENLYVKNKNEIDEYFAGVKNNE